MGEKTWVARDSVLKMRKLMVAWCSIKRRWMGADPAAKQRLQPHRCCKTCRLTEPKKAPLGYNQAQYKALFRPINPGLSPSFHHIAHET